MSNLIRRMQRLATRDQRAKKAAIGRQFATRLGVSNPKAKDLLARHARRTRAATIVPRALRRSKKSIAWLKARAERRQSEESRT